MSIATTAWNWRPAAIFLSLVFALQSINALSSEAFPATGDASQFDIVWTTPGRGSQDSMPLGNGDIGLNVWSEGNGDTVFYISKTDSWLIQNVQGDGGLVKLGKIRLRMTPNPFGEDFKQALLLNEGRIELSGKSGARLSIWVDANNPVVNVEASGDVPFILEASYEMWRTVDEHLPPQAADGKVLWFHRNSSSPYKGTVDYQSLSGMLNGQPDPLLNRTFGCLMQGGGFKRTSPSSLSSAAPAKSQHMAITALTKVTDTPEAFAQALETEAAKAAKLDLDAARKAHAAWWSAFWERSWILPSLGSKQDSNSALKEDVRRLAQAYALQRYMSACAGRGAYPVKFNGSIFTMDLKDGGKTLGADERKWGAAYWFQNTRLIYWPMLASGDFEMMRPLFEMYSGILPFLKDRTRLYFDHDGAFFPETMLFWGAYVNRDYGGGREFKPLGLCGNRYIAWHWNGTLELSAMMLAWRQYSGDDSYFKDSLLPSISAFAEFFDKHYPKQLHPDGRRRLVLAPSQALETYWGTVNPTPDIAGLKRVTSDLLELPKGLGSQEQREQWGRLAEAIPPISLADANWDWASDYRKKGAPPPKEALAVKRIMAAASLGQCGNFEDPELYAIFPFRIYGVGRPGLDIGRASFKARLNSGNFCWHQDEIHAAMLGLSKEASEGLLKRAKGGCDQCRFPAFWAQGHDWVPDMDHGGPLMFALQSMLLQCVDGKLYLLPAWPKDWDVSFKLHAPGARTVKGVFRDGKLESLEIKPELNPDQLVVMEPQ